MIARLSQMTLISMLLFSAISVVNGQDEVGKLFIKAQMTEVDGKLIPDSELEESVRDMKKRHGKFTLVDKEEDAEFLIVVNERVSVSMAGSPAAKSILETLYIRKDGNWEPATKLKSGTKDTFWGMAAEKVVKNAAKWIKESSGK